MNRTERKQTKFERVCSFIIVLLLNIDLSSVTDSPILSFVFALVWGFVYWVAWNHYFFVYGRKPWLAYIKMKWKIDEFFMSECYAAAYGKPLIFTEAYQKGCKLIDELCKDKLIPIEEKETLYQNLCGMWTVCGGVDHNCFTIPLFIQDKWKKAQAEDKLRQLKKDF